eukprot:m.74929 g.74929  ORF g.74929 m.74929 type:complete len:257 (+) comp7789_c0_seq1:1-771(+)
MASMDIDNSLEDIIAKGKSKLKKKGPVLKGVSKSKTFKITVENKMKGQGVAKQAAGKKQPLAYSRPKELPDKWKHDLFEGPGSAAARKLGAAGLKRPAGDLRSAIKNKNKVLTLKEAAVAPVKAAAVKQLRSASATKAAARAASAAPVASGPVAGTARLVVSNLQPSVTQQDMKELFETVGPVARVALADDGTCDVLFRTPAHAAEAQHKYHNIALDGALMDIKLAAVEPPVRVSVLSRLGVDPSARVSRMRSDTH